LGADSADARAAHPPREGDEQHLHQPRTARPSRHGLPERSRTAGTARDGGTVHTQGPLCGRATGEDSWCLAGVWAAVLQGVQSEGERLRGRSAEAATRCGLSCGTGAGALVSETAVLHQRRGDGETNPKRNRRPCRRMDEGEITSWTKTSLPS